MEGNYALDLREGEAAPWVAGSPVSTTAVKAVGKLAVNVDDFPHLDGVQRLTREAWPTGVMRLVLVA